MQMQCACSATLANIKPLQDRLRAPNALIFLIRLLEAHRAQLAYVTWGMRVDPTGAV